MKILKAGTKPWWHGKQMTCSECGQVAELEARDEHSPSWMNSEARGRVRVQCSNCCTGVMILSRGSRNFCNDADAA